MFAFNTQYLMSSAKSAPSTLLIRGRAAIIWDRKADLTVPCISLFFSKKLRSVCVLWRYAVLSGGVVLCVYLTANRKVCGRLGWDVQIKPERI